MMKRTGLIYIFSWIIIITLIFLNISNFIRFNLHQSFITADFFTFASLYRDIFMEGGNIVDWKLAPSPYFFPDMLVYFILARFIDHSMTIALIFAILQPLALLISIRFMLRYSKSTWNILDDININAVAIIFLATLLLFTDLLFPIYISIFWHSFHVSTFIVACILFTISIKLFTEANNKLYILSIAIVSLITIISDRFFIFWFNIPFIISLFALYFFKYIDKKLFRLNVITQIATISFAYLTILLFNRYDIISHGTPNFTTNFINELVSNLSVQIGFGILILNILIFSIYIAKYLPSFKENRKTKELFYSFFVITLISVGLIVPIALGIFVDQGSLRYITPLCFFGLFSLLFIFKVNRLWLLGIGLSLAIGASIIRYPFFSFDKYYEVPNSISCIESLQAKYGFEYGISGFWDSATVRNLTNHKVIVDIHNNEGKARFWLSSRKWFRENNGKYTFVITGDQLKSLWLEKLGQPQYIETCNEKTILLYDKPFSIAE